MLTVRDVAGRLNVSLGCVYTLISRGELPCHRIGIGRGAIRVREADLDEYLDSCRVETGPESLQSSRPTRRNALFKHLDGERLRSAWRRQGVHSDGPNVCNTPSSGSKCDP